jgi:pyrimidine operon attenuation protein/uracil phosphoribosyltransferase
MGYARDFVEVCTELAPDVVEKGFKIISNAGGVNPVACAEAIVEGARRRGTALARQLAAIIEDETGYDVPVHTLDVEAYREDRDGDAPALPDGPPVTDRDVVLVDDVLFTGRTSRAALEAVLAHGRPRSIQLVILVDRGHREYPIQPDFVGTVIPTKHTERVVVEVEGEDVRVFLDD